MVFPGHLYVIEFADGVVKVGQSGVRTIESRLNAHLYRAAGTRSPAVQHWTSPVVENVQLAETALIQWCIDWPFSALHYGREWFTGLDYETTVYEAEHLAGPGVAQRELLGRMNRARVAAGLPIFVP